MARALAFLADGEKSKLKKDHQLQHICLGYVKLDIAENAKFDVSLGKDEKLIPIVFQHGLGATVPTHSMHVRELASHGYVVFCPESIAGCAMYTELEGN